MASKCDPFAIIEVEFLNFILNFQTFGRYSELDLCFCLEMILGF